MEDKVISLESEAGFRVLFEYATIGILVVSTTGRIELANPGAANLFGYEKGELTGQKLEILIPDGLRHRHVHHRKDYFEKPKSRPMGLGMALYARKKDGSIFPVEISLGHYQLGGEKLAVAFITDITARLDSEQKLRKINEELENSVRERTLELTEALEYQKEMNELKSRFVSLASHEFRTPLSTILSSVSLVDRYTELGNEEKRKKHIERIRSSVKNLTFILNDFLSLDKLEQGKMETNKESFDFEEFINDVLEEIDGMLKEGQEILFKHHGNKKILQDKKILRNVLLNLLSNAVKYSKEGKIIKINTKVNNDFTVVEVIDQGIGIPEDEEKFLFKKFFRAKNAVNYQGTGLGLNIVKRYMELLDGTIDMVSKQNVGTTVTIKFPSKHTRVSNILIIDDNLEIRENTSELLAISGYAVRVALNGAEGLSMISKEIPDLILLDVQMPEVNGFEVLSMLKKQESTAGIPFIFLTASMEKREILKGLKMEANEYLCKPYEFNDLIAAIERCLRK